MSAFEELADLVSEYQGIPRETLEPSSRFLHDLGIWGDDADILLAEIGERWNVDWDGIDASRYWYGESHLFAWAGSLRAITGTMHRSPKESLTLGHLAAVLERGEWFEPSPQE